MSLSTNVNDFALRAATECKSLRNLINGNVPDLSALNTTAQNNLVAAINEVLAAIGSAAGIDDGVIGTGTTWSSTKIDAEIDDARADLGADIAAKPSITDAATNTTSVWSSQKTTDYVISVRDALVGGASAAYDTLIELQNALQSDDTDIAALTTAVGNRVRFDAAQTLTAPQQAQARTNIDAASATDVGSTTTNYVSTFEAGLV